MKINESFLNNNLSKAIENFKLQNFNILSSKERQDAILKLATLVSTSLNCTLNSQNIQFVNQKELDNAGALFNFNNNTILLNKNFLNRQLDEYEMVTFLDHIIHETIHYCQKQKQLFLNDLKLTLPFPYNLLQKHETSAYKLTGDFLQKCKSFLDKNLCDIIDLTSQVSAIMHNNCIDNLDNRGYDTSTNEIELQISILMPFYKDVSQLKSLKENNEFTIKIKKGKQSIDVIKINDKLMGAINVKEKDGINSLYFTINKNTCCINEICKENKSKQLVSMSEENKLILIELLNKIIDIGNKGNYIDCTQIEINPISTTATKTEHDKFVNDIKNGTIKISLESKIPEKQIKKKIFEDIDR